MQDIDQDKFERISELMASKGVPHEAFELLADLHPARIRAEARAEAAERAEMALALMFDMGQITRDKAVSMMRAAILADEPKEREPESSRLLECSVCGNLEGAPYEQGDACSMCGVGVYRRSEVERKLKEAKP